MTIYISFARSSLHRDTY